MRLRGRYGGAVIGTILLLAGSATGALCRPGNALQAGRLVAEADTIVIGRVMSTEPLEPRPRIRDGGTMFHDAMTIMVSSVVKEPRELARILPVDVRSYNPPRDHVFAIYFLNCGTGRCVNTALDHWALAALQINPARRRMPEDPAQTVAREMLALLATSSAQLADPVRGAMHTGPADSGPGGFHRMAVEAVRDMPDAMVEPKLRRLAASPDTTLRLWAVDALLERGAAVTLPGIVPDMPAPFGRSRRGGGADRPGYDGKEITAAGRRAHNTRRAPKQIKVFLLLFLQKKKILFLC